MRRRSQWLDKIPEPGVRCRAERRYQRLDILQHRGWQARRELLAESRKHAITARRRQIRSLRPNRSALAVALIQTRHHFPHQAPAVDPQRTWVGDSRQAGNITSSKAKCGGARNRRSFVA